MSEIHGRIVINGKEYASFDEVPAVFRALLRKAVQSSAVKTKYKVNGKEYGSVEEMPEELRTLIFGKSGMPTLDGPHVIRPTLDWTRLALILAAVGAALGVWWIRR